MTKAIRNATVAFLVVAFCIAGMSMFGAVIAGHWGRSVGNALRAYDAPKAAFALATQASTGTLGRTGPRAFAQAATQAV